jgi:hypothetical protein
VSVSEENAVAFLVALLVANELLRLGLLPDVRL